MSDHGRGVTLSDRIVPEGIWQVSGRSGVDNKKQLTNIVYFLLTTGYFIYVEVNTTYLVKPYGCFIFWKPPLDRDNASLSCPPYLCTIFKRKIPVLSCKRNATTHRALPSKHRDFHKQQSEVDRAQGLPRVLLLSNIGVAWLYSQSGWLQTLLDICFCVYMPYMQPPLP